MEVETLLRDRSSTDQITRTNANRIIAEKKSDNSFLLSLLELSVVSAAFRDISLVLAHSILQDRFSELEPSFQSLIIDQLLKVSRCSTDVTRRRSHTSIAFAISKCCTEKRSAFLTSLMSDIRTSGSSLEDRIGSLELLTMVLEDTPKPFPESHLSDLMSTLESCIPVPELRKIAFHALTTSAIVSAQAEDTGFIQRVDLSPWITSLPVLELVDDFKTLVFAEVATPVSPVISALMAKCASFLESTDNSPPSDINPIIDLFASVAASDVSLNAFSNLLPRIFTSLVPYLRITPEEELEWTQDLSMFISIESVDDYAIERFVRSHTRVLIANLALNPFFDSETMEVLFTIGSHQSGDWQSVEAGLSLLQHATAKFSPQIMDYVRPLFHRHEPFLKARVYLILAKVTDCISAIEARDMLAQSVSEWTESSGVVDFAVGRLLTSLLPKIPPSQESLVMHVFDKSIVVVESSSGESLSKALEIVRTVFDCCPFIMARIDLMKYGKVLVNTLMVHVENPFTSILIEELVNQVTASEEISSSRYSEFCEVFCELFVQWINPQEECKLDVALEYIAGFVARLDRPGKHMRACMEKISSFRDDLVAIGPVTEELVEFILTHS